MANLQTQITSLEALIEKANALPSEKKIQEAKTATPMKAVQTVSPDSGYDGLAGVTVAAIPDQYEDITTPLAELNTANGGTEAATMAAAVDNTEAHVSSQEVLIAQIATALEGKAAGGSGGSVETCTVTVNSGYAALTGYAYTAFEDGEYVIHTDVSNAGFDLPFIMNNVVCGSMLVCYLSGYMVGCTAENMTKVGLLYGAAQPVFKAPTNSGEIGTITTFNND